MERFNQIKKKGQKVHENINTENKALRSMGSFSEGEENGGKKPHGKA